MISLLAMIWPQPLDPFHSVALSALVAALPLILVLVLMGLFRRSGLVSSASGLGAAILLALLVWRMPAVLVMWSAIYGFVYALFPILWIVFCALWLYNLTQDTGKFELLRRWMGRSASGDPCIQAILVAFCFGALLEGTAGFGAPVAVTACLLAGLGMEKKKSVIVALIANTAPVAFGGIGIPIVALAGVTGLDLSQLSSMVGRQVPFLSLVLPAYLACVVDGLRGLRRTWPAALVAGATFALAQFAVSNLWGPYAADLIASTTSIAATVILLRFWTPAARPRRRNQRGYPRHSRSRAATLTTGEAFAAWLPWLLLSAVMVFWTYFHLLQFRQFNIPVASLHNGVLITLYQRSYAAVYAFQPMGVGTAVLVTTILTALCFRVRPGSSCTRERARFASCACPGSPCSSSSRWLTSITIPAWPIRLALPSHVSAPHSHCSAAILDGWPASSAEATRPAIFSSAICR